MARMLGKTLAELDPMPIAELYAWGIILREEREALEEIAPKKGAHRGRLPR